MLTQQNLKEIFRAFIMTGEVRPSTDLFGALAKASGETEAGLKEAYNAYCKSLTDDDSDALRE